MRKKWILGALLVVIYLLHQDFWNWQRHEPMVFGFVPIGLAYHAFYSIVAAAMMAVLVKFAWPKELDEADNQGKTPGKKDGQ